MSTFIIRIQQDTLTNGNDFSLLQAMKNENFAPLSGNETAAEKSFIYYGNMEATEINDAVNRASTIAGQSFYFTVSKDQLSERQYHLTPALS
ncbi:MAG: hypothetical protein QM726_13145 [Chitinophagaceae bacterium]